MRVVEAKGIHSRREFSVRGLVSRSKNASGHIYKFIPQMRIIPSLIHDI